MILHVLLLGMIVGAQEPRCPVGSVEIARDLHARSLDCVRIDGLSLEQVRRVRGAAIERLSDADRHGLRQREAVLLLAGRSAHPSRPPESWEAFETALRVPEGRAPRDPLPAVPIAGAVAAAAGAAWAWMYKNRRAIAGTLIAVAAILAIVVLLKSPPPPLVAVASRLGLAGWIAGPRGVVTSDSRLLRLTKHAVVKASKWQVSMEEIREVARMPSFPYFHEGVWKTGHWDPATRVFIGSYNNVVTTVIGDVKPQYIRNIMSRRP